MQVNVFITHQDGDARTKLLVLPSSPNASIPPQFRLGWIYYATTNTSDAMFGDLDAMTLEEQLARQGYAIVRPETPDRR
ncbi:MAG TPA: hypothetical protein VGB81_16655 [Devosia sp.]|jgi:hypothetical protein